jgi:hypothetical protein
VDCNPSPANHLDKEGHVFTQLTVQLVNSEMTIGAWRASQTLWRDPKRVSNVHNNKGNP